MYLPNQIIYDINKKEPFCVNNPWKEDMFPSKNTSFNFVNKKRKIYLGKVNLPTDIPKELIITKELLKRKIIEPTNCQFSHCPSCSKWLTQKYKESCKEPLHKKVFIKATDTTNVWHPIKYLNIKFTEKDKKRWEIN